MIVLLTNKTRTKKFIIENRYYFKMKISINGSKVR